MKRIITPSLFALFVIATGCNEKTSQNQTVNQVKKEAVTQVPHPKVERGGEWIEAYAIGTWISENDAQYVMQKKYTSSDSMIEKKWEKSGYDVAKFSSDGKMIALLSWNYNRSSEDAILICDRSSGKRKFSVQAKLDQTNSICCAFSPDSRYFYYITEDKYFLALRRIQHGI